MQRASGYCGIQGSMRDMPHPISASFWCQQRQHKTQVLKLGALSADVGVANAVGPGTDGGVWQEGAVVVEICASLCVKVQLLNHLYQGMAATQPFRTGCQPPWQTFSTWQRTDRERCLPAR